MTFELPNEVTFTARWWSDGFFWWMETNHGYRIVQGDDGYYYYAVLDERGEFAASEERVGIDETLALSYQLERSQDRIDEIEAKIDSFEIGLEIAYQNYLDKRAASQEGNITYRIGVILVDFTPSKRWSNTLNPDGYEKAAFDSTIFSKDYWIGSPNPQPGEPLTPHPDQHALFGSMADYYRVKWDGRNQAGHQVGSGVYIYRFTAEALDGSEQFNRVKKMILLR